MKTNIFLLILLMLSTSVQLSAQDSFQAFPSEGFKIKCGCKLYSNSMFIQLVKEQGINNLMAAYICAENEYDPATGVIININVYDLSENFQKISSAYHEYFIRRTLEKYAENLSQAGIHYEYINFQGGSALEYNFIQNDMPRKALYFFRNQRNYLLQVGSRTGLAQKYSDLKNSFVAF